MQERSYPNPKHGAQQKGPQITGIMFRFRTVLPHGVRRVWHLLTSDNEFVSDVLALLAHLLFSDWIRQETLRLCPTPPGPMVQKALSMFFPRRASPIATK